ncbi:hypothetical protein [Chitinophaga pinensis]|uniref:Uncharacterized protein n=1 Tax=Chitinophaga pinensis (strain ATCC 43595 / DSM 2588 / LMG 13176 / NBRC 15968 / NCIMB 11800 / UQM 2034) TaxID=485918 RepID=A0A979G5F1_CHIPD|nr:hypothetical protein [Chitinophaga pinensis]ACU61043.1 hypothetical protein Cpin_3580 [Chitinophaga pinensis DSM 2588]
MKVFALSRGFKILLYILLAIMLFVFVALALGPFYDPKLNFPLIYFWPVCAIPICLIICAFLQVEEKVIVDKYSIRKVSRLINREILLSNIKGYKSDGNGLWIIPNTGKRIYLSGYVKGVNDLQTWLANWYPDINHMEEMAIYSEVTDSYDEQERAQRRKRAGIELRILGGITIVLGILTWRCYAACPWLGVALFCCIPAALYLTLRHKGFIQLIDNSAGSLPGSSFISFTVLCGLMSVWYFTGITDYSGVWTTFAVIVAALALLFWECTRDFNRRTKRFYVSAIILTVLSLANAFFVTIVLNRCLDTSEIAYYEAGIRKKEITIDHFVPFYHIYLEPWEHAPESEEVNVKSSFYRKLRANEKVGIYYHKGGLGMPWYEVGEKQTKSK